MRGLIPLVLLVIGSAARGDGAPPPWQRTETREPCAAPIRSASRSSATCTSTRATPPTPTSSGRASDPRDAYDFARGRGRSPLADDERGADAHARRIDRPLDFAAVTDHAEFFGEVDLCSTAGLAGLRRPAVPAPAPGRAGPERPVPGRPSAGCSRPASRTRRRRSPFCVAARRRLRRRGRLGLAGDPGRGRGGLRPHRGVRVHDLHRLRAHREPARPPPAPQRHLPQRARAAVRRRATSRPLAGGIPQGLWSAIETQCLERRHRLRRRHHPAQPEPERRRAVRRPGRRRRGAAAPDARAAGRDPPAEGQLGVPLRPARRARRRHRGRAVRLRAASAARTRVPTTGRRRSTSYPLRNLVRNALKDGLAFEETARRRTRSSFGFIGSTDTHNAHRRQRRRDRLGRRPGQRRRDRRRARSRRRAATNPGGLAVVVGGGELARRDLRGARRRETYATSGTRPMVRFFAGDLDGRRVRRRRPRRSAPTRSGTPMGGELGAVRGAASPRFAVCALKDPGTRSAPGTDLQRMQIVKGWVDADGADARAGLRRRGQRRERRRRRSGDLRADGRGRARAVRRLGGSRVRPPASAPSTTRACSRTRPAAGARASARRPGVDPLLAGLRRRRPRRGRRDFADCCRGPANDAFPTPVIQERAWTSPIWYRPEGIAPPARAGRVRQAARPRRPQRCASSSAAPSGLRPAARRPGRPRDATTTRSSPSPSRPAPWGLENAAAARPGSRRPSCASNPMAGRCWRSAPSRSACHTPTAATT